MEEMRCLWSRQRLYGQPDSSMDEGPGAAEPYVAGDVLARETASVSQ